MTDTAQPAWGALIERRRNEMRPKLSARKAAERAGISEGRWRQIVKGYQSTSGGKIPVVGPAATVARMANVVGVTPDELAAMGRPDAAEELRSEDSYPTGPLEPAFTYDAAGAQVVWAELQAWMAAADDEWPEDPPTGALVFWSTNQLLEALRDRNERNTEHIKHLVKIIREKNRQLAERDLFGGGDGHVDDSGDSAPTTVELAPAANDTDELQQRPGAGDDEE